MCCFCHKMDMGCTAQVFTARPLVEFDVPSHQYDLQNKNHHSDLQYEVTLAFTNHSAEYCGIDYHSDLQCFEYL